MFFMQIQVRKNCYNLGTKWSTVWDMRKEEYKKIKWEWVSSFFAYSSIKLY